LKTKIALQQMYM